jgi:hypothetical protein
VSVRPYRYYQVLKAPAGETAGQTYTVLLYAFRHLRQSDVDARMAKIKIKIETEWKAKLRLNGREVDRLAWALCVMQVTEPIEKSAHPDVVKEKKIESAHRRIDKAVRKLTPQLSQLVKFHDAHTDVLLLAALNSYTAARQPVGGPMPRAGRIPWHRDAAYLWNVLAEVAERTGKPLTHQKEEGPAVTFISRALEKSPAAVVKALVRRKKRIGLSP